MTRDTVIVRTSLYLHCSLRLQVSGWANPRMCTLIDRDNTDDEGEVQGTETQQSAPQYKRRNDRRLKCYVCVGRDLEVYKEVTGQRNAREMSSSLYSWDVLSNWRNKTPRQCAISTLQKNSRVLVVKVFIQERLTSITIDKCTTVPL